jgi:hypothetical protein
MIVFKILAYETNDGYDTQLKPCCFIGGHKNRRKNNQFTLELDFVFIFGLFLLTAIGRMDPPFW